jgi:tetratricopeptide (TPR) repeat protein
MSGTPAQAAPADTLPAILTFGHGAILPAERQVNDDPTVLFQEGARALSSGNYDLAGERFRQVIQLDPTSSAAHTNLGVTYMRQKRWVDAISELQTAHTLSPAQMGTVLNIGLAYYRQNDFTAAIEPFTQARYLLGLCYFFTGNYALASKTLEPLWQSESNNLNYLYVLSIAASKSSNSRLQKQAFDQMLSIGQNAPAFHLYLGKAWLAQDNTANALAEFKKALAAQPDFPMVHYFLGRTYLQQHNYTLAEQELSKDTEIEPAFAYNYEDLGILHTMLAEPAKAEQDFTLAVSHDPTLANSYFNLAKIYRASSRFPEALAAIDHASALVPKSASVHYLRAQVLARLGRKQQADEEFRKAAQLLKEFNDQIQKDPSGTIAADAQNAAQQ